MKTFGVVLLAALLCELASANKVRLRARPWLTPVNSALQIKTTRSDSVVEASKSRVREDANPCPGGVPNRFPDTLPADYSLVGMNKLDMVWDTLTLREALKKDPQWLIGRPWILKATFTNNGNADRVFGFQGGFLELKVPAGCIDCEIMVQGNVLSSANHTEFQYRSEANFTSGQVEMSKICLTPKACSNFTCPQPSTQKLMTDAFGDSPSACCAQRMCKDELTCLPDTKWEPKQDFDTKVGSTLATCCKPKACPVDICENETAWVKDPASGRLGSTREECCLQKECLDWTCSDINIWTKKDSVVFDGTDNVTVKGWSDIECCEEKMCKDYAIPVELKTVWQLKPDAANIVGNNVSTCCEPIFCGDSFQCPNNTEWRDKPQVRGRRPGSTQEECCEQLFCSNYNCSNSSTHQKKIDPKTRPGSTDQECCELRYCKDWECSDKTKWVHLSDQAGLTNLDRRGSSDEECCDKIFCNAEICEPSTKWKFKGEDVMGSTVEQCCEPIYCGDYSCENETAWYRKVDTNTFKWQGSSDEECCLPIYCSQYFTSTPTQWTRKPWKHLQGNTDLECYDQLWCYDYCCVGAGWEKKPGATTRPGSTDAECCTPKRDLPDVHEKTV